MDITFWRFICWFFFSILYFPVHQTTQVQGLHETISYKLGKQRKPGIQGVLQSALMNSVRQRSWISKSGMQRNALCLLPGPLPGSHQPIKFISIGQVWKTGTMPDRESKLQFPRTKHLFCSTPNIILAEPQLHCSCMKPITMNHWAQMPATSLKLKELPAEGYGTQYGERIY